MSLRSACAGRSQGTFWVFLLVARRDSVLAGGVGGRSGAGSRCWETLEKHAGGATGLGAPKASLLDVGV